MKAKAKSKCPFFIPGKAALTDVQRSLYGDDAGWCDEQDAPCAKEYLCPSAKIIQTLTGALEVIASIPAPDVYIPNNPCEACKKRIRLAKKALNGKPTPAGSGRRKPERYPCRRALLAKMNKGGSVPLTEILQAASGYAMRTLADKMQKEAGKAHVQN